MTISSPGIGSGLDINGIIAKLMQVEQQPLVALAKKEGSYQVKLSAFGSLQGALSALQSAIGGLIPSVTQTAAEKFRTYSASIADTTIASATASATAVAGSYSLEVTTLAKEHRLQSAPYASTSTVVGTGTIVLERGTVKDDDGPGGNPPYFTRKTGTSAVTVTIDSTNNTLAGIRDAINDAKAGVTATIVTGDGSARLLLTSDSTGTSDIMQISGTLADLNHDPAAGTGLTQSQAATDASLKINTIPITSTSNTIAEAITGVSLTLAKENATTTITVSKNTTAALTSAFTALAKAYSDAAKTMKDLGKYDPETKEAGPLLGNATLRSVQSQLRRVLGESPAGATGAYKRLAEIGITLQRDGSMKVDSTKLQAAITADYDSVAALAGAMGSALKSTMDGILGIKGTVTSAKAGLDKSIKEIADEREDWKVRLTRIEARYKRQFTALDTTVAGMNSTSSYLQQQLASLTASISK